MPTDARSSRADIAPDSNTAVSSDAAVLAAILDDEHPRKLAAAEWARRELEDPELADRDLECRFWHDGWQKLAREGMLGLVVEEELGGSALELCSALLSIEGLGLGCRDDGLIFALSSQILTMQLTLQRFGTEDQRRTWLPELITGRAFGAFAMSEPEAGSDAFSLTTRATRTSNGYRLDGTKAWVTMAPLADVIIVFASTDPDVGRWGISAFLVPVSTPGVDVGPNRPKMGLRTTPFADVVLSGCEVPVTSRIGAEGAGASIFSAAMEAERAFLLAGAVGALERTLDDAVAYASRREQFGQPIGSFQAVSHLIAAAKLGHASARTLLYKAAALQQQGTPSMMAAALAKLAASEATLEGTLAAVEVHGARGYVSEFGVERDLRNSIGGIIYGGSSGIQKNIIARMLGLPG